MQHFLAHKYGAQFVPVVGYDERVMCILLKYYPSGSLRQWLESPANDRRQSHIVGIHRDIARGIQAMHRESFVHCDIKSDNVLIEISGGDKKEIRAFITDFGIARIVSRDVIRVRQLHAHVLRGLSIAYASPESIVKWKPKLDFTPDELRASDVYSSACVLYECLVGKRIWSLNK